MLKICNNCGFTQNEFLNLGGRNYCKSCNYEITVSSSQKLEQKQKTTHQLKLALGNLRLMLEPLEGFIEKAYNEYYPDFRNRRQLYGKTIQGNYPLENFEETFLTQLLIMKGVCKNEPEFFRNEIKNEYYKWIELVGIDVNNCPKKLKHWLFEINEVLEDRGEKIVKEKEERIKNTKLEMKDVVELFRDLQNPLNKNREERENYESKGWNELGNENRFEGSGEKGQETFKEISREITPRQDSFSFYPLQQRSNSEIIQDIKDNRQNWRVDEIILDLSKSQGEKVLVHRNSRLDDYDQEGKLNLEGNPIYLAERFSGDEVAEINQVLNISQSSTSQYCKLELKPAKKSPPKSPKNANKFGTTRIVVSSVAIVSILAIAGTVAIRKKLNQKKKG